MSFWLKKSKGNLQAAEAMANNADFCHSSVHCAYYGCLQLIKHVLHYEQKPPITLKTDGGVHNEAKRTMYRILAAIDRGTATAFNNDYGDLQTYRNESDYDDVDITLVKADTAYKTARRIFQTITSSMLHE